jgi:hypothetical protein
MAETQQRLMEMEQCEAEALVKTKLHLWKKVKIIDLEHFMWTRMK